MIRRLALGALCALAAAATVQPAPAQAATVCAFTDGLVGDISPPMGLAPVAGSYTFAAEATCAVDGELLPARLSSVGGFDFVTCGTGAMQGLMEVLTPRGNISFHYHIVIAGFSGSMDDGAGAIHLSARRGDCATGITQLEARGWFRWP